MKHVVGLPNSVGTRTTVFALSRVQWPGPTATAAEQMSTNAVSIAGPHLLAAGQFSHQAYSSPLWGHRLRLYAGARRQDGDLMRRGGHAAEHQRWIS